VATLAFDSPYDSEPAAKPPLSRHPAFPAIVALWFAALLGVGSLVLPAVLLDKIVGMTGIAALVPSAAPPLGLTARSLIALVGALAGAGIGVTIARRVARAHAPEPVSRIAKLAGGQRRPISVHEELGGEGVTNGEGLPISRRRALAISEDDRPSDFLYRAPLPGVDDDAPVPFAAAPIVEAEPDDVPLELSELAAEAEPAALEAEAAAEHDDSPDGFAVPERQEFKSAWPTEQHYPRDEVPEPDSELDTRKNLAGPRGLEPLPFSAPSLARKPPQVVFEPEPEPEPEPELEPEVPLEAVQSPTIAADEPEYQADWETAPLDGLGLVQLVQRLGSTIERRREWTAQAAVAAAAPLPAPFAAAPADFEPAPAEEAAQAMAAFFAPNSEPEADEPEPVEVEAQQAEEEGEPAAMPPPFLSSFNTVVADDEDEDQVPDFSLPLRRPAAAAPVAAAADNDAAEAEDEAEASQAEYSSLLGMKNPFAAPKTEFVRIEEPEEEAELAEPTVVFPGQEEPAPATADSARLFDPPGNGAAPAAAAPQAPADADAALRAALATLQRMSGAA
jgi:hypothetical protein